MTEAARIAEGRPASIERQCTECGVTFVAPRYRVLRGQGNTCSRSCSAKRAGRAFADTRPKPTDAELVAYLWANVDRRSSSDCWPWLRSASVNGRGVVSFRGFRMLAPRLAYFAGGGGWPPKDMFVCHSCDNPACCNPAHLWLGTPKDNAVDMGKKGRTAKQKNPATECKQGHPLTGENAYIDGRGNKSCRTCRKARSKQWSIKNQRAQQEVKDA